MTNREEQRKGRETAVNAQAALREKAVAVTGLSKSYSGKKVIENLNLTIRTGQIYGLLGANGAGKSTAVECILGTRRADSGEVRILGLDPVTERRHLFEQVGVQFQEASYPDRIKVRELCMLLWLRAGKTCRAGRSRGFLLYWRSYQVPGWYF